MNDIESRMQAAGSTLDNLKSGIERTAAGAHAAINDATDAVHPVLDKLAASSHVAVDKSCGIASDAADAASIKVEEYGKAQARLADTAIKCVRAHPLKVLVAAVAIAFTGSRLLSRPKAIPEV
jgi:hypothetical protein